MADPVTWAIIGSTALTAGGQLLEGNEAEKIARMERKQLERKAKAKFAEGTREAAERRRQDEIIRSNIRAQMAAGGGVTDDPGAIATLGKVRQIGEYNALSAMYEAETEAQGLRYAGQVRRYEGKAAKRASRIKALSTAIKGGGQAYGQHKGI